MLGVDRLDMIKGIPQKLLAFEKFLYGAGRRRRRRTRQTFGAPRWGSLSGPSVAALAAAALHPRRHASSSLFAPALPPPPPAEHPEWRDKVLLVQVRPRTSSLPPPRPLRSSCSRPCPPCCPHAHRGPPPTSLPRHPIFPPLPPPQQIAVPSRTDVPEYQRLRSMVHEIVGRINGAFGTLTYVPIHHLDRQLSFHELCALYAVTGAEGGPGGGGGGGERRRGPWIGRGQVAARLPGLRLQARPPLPPPPLPPPRRGAHQQPARRHEPRQLRVSPKHRPGPRRSPQGLTSPASSQHASRLPRPRRAAGLCFALRSLLLTPTAPSPARRPHPGPKVRRLPVRQRRRARAVRVCRRRAEPGCGRDPGQPLEHRRRGAGVGTGRGVGVVGATGSCALVCRRPRRSCLARIGRRCHAPPTRQERPPSRRARPPIVLCRRPRRLRTR
jgi:hypothetical protein